MRDVCILTYWGVANYGAWVQAYCFNRLVSQLLNRSVFHIGYLEESHWDIYFNQDERLLNAFNYSWRIIPHIEIPTGRELENTKFDTFITGSDSIWSFEQYHINPDMHLVGKDIDANRKIAYAVSCDMLLHSEAPKNMGNLIESYDAVSVRDNYTRETVKKLCNLNDESVVLVLDPALMWELRYDPLVSPPVYKDYIVVYGLNWDEDFIKAATSYAKKKGLKTISVGYINSWCDFSVKMLELRCPEWLGMFANAERVFTSTFHGLMVGLNFRKQVKFDQVEGVKNRSQSLIENLGIQDAIYSFDEEIEWCEFEKKLMREREKSLTFLRKALDYKR